MSVENNKGLERRRKSEPASATRGSKDPKSNRKGTNSGEVGQALRSIYQRTINEDVPPDLLDLLGKLG